VPGVVVTTMATDDLDAVRAVEQACFDDPWTTAGWHQELTRDDRRWRVGRSDADGEVVGFGGLWLAPDAAHVLRLAVRPDRRGHGAGARLVEALLAQAEAEGLPATLEVRASNRAAISLYRRQGFVSHGLRPGYYADREDALVLWREPGTIR
jgi:[ribosomal protein S18]-alanine N-acetyltransferase